jgi:hypothetical protein
VGVIFPLIFDEKSFKPPSPPPDAEGVKHTVLREYVCTRDVCDIASDAGLAPGAILGFTFITIFVPNPPIRLAIIDPVAHPYDVVAVRMHNADNKTRYIVLLQPHVGGSTFQSAAKTRIFVWGHGESSGAAEFIGDQTVFPVQALAPPAISCSLCKVEQLQLIGPPIAGALVFPTDIDVHDDGGKTRLLYNCRHS